MVSRKGFENLLISVFLSFAINLQHQSLAYSIIQDVDPSVGHDFGNGCRVGTKYNSPDINDVGLCNSSLWEALVKGHPELFITTEAYCSGKKGLPEFGRAICGCDCLYGHRAYAGHDTCIPEAHRAEPTPCKCIYEEGGNPCPQTPTVFEEENLNNQKLIPHWLKRRSIDSFNLLSPLKGIVGKVDSTLGDVFSGICRPILEGIITLGCESKPITILTTTYYGVDLCIIDCICTHGSKTPPFGACRREYDDVLKLDISVCYCFD